MKTRLITFSLFFFALTTSIFSTHNIAGEIIYRQISERSIIASIHTYTDGLILAAERDSLQICWGDGDCDFLIRTNGPDEDMDGFPDGVFVENNYKFNIYLGQHEYEDKGKFTLSLSDPNRQGNILNVNYPQSHLINFYLETDVYLGDEPNDSPFMLEQPIDIGFENSTFKHIPNAFDSDGDRIEYSLVSPLMNAGLAVLNYQMVDQIMPGANNVISIDSETGFVNWNAPQTEGLYVIAIELKTYRDGVLNGRVIRDMQIRVLPELNILPRITHDDPNQNIIREVEVGEEINISMTADDDGNSQVVNVFSTSPLYFLGNQLAEFTNDSPGSAQFKWTVGEELIREEPYQLVFQATDSIGYANYSLFRFKVVEEPNNTEDFYFNDFVKIYPNPVVDVLYLESKLDRGLDFKIYDSMAKILHSGTIRDHLEIPFKSLPSGMYFMEFSDGTRKLIMKD